MIPIRKIQSTVSLFLLLLLCGACEDWLSVSPKSEIKYDDLFKTKNGFKDQLTGIYTALCSEDLYGANLTYGAMDALGQQYLMESGQGSNKYYYISRFEYENAGSVELIEKMWNQMYNTVANINILLQGIEEHPGVLSAEEEAVYKGEALGLRAFLHFDLLRIFGKSWQTGAKEAAIPYVKVISKNVTPLSTVEATVDLVIQDLEAAAILLEKDPIKTGVETALFLGTREWHFNYYAVRAMLARAYLFKNDRTNALKNALEVITSDIFPLVEREKVTTPTDKSRDRIFVTEGIFMLNNTKIGNLTDQFLRPGRADKQENVLLMQESTLAGIYEKNKYGTFDWRCVYLFSDKDEYYYSTKLWQLDGMPKEYQNRQPLLKSSEMYLIAAECASVKKEAVDYFNTFRQHRGFAEGDDLLESIADPLFRTEITKEYRKEFIGEGQWFFYCKRIDKETLPDIIVSFSKSYYQLPLPDMEKEYGNRN